MEQSGEGLLGPCIGGLTIDLATKQKTTAFAVVFHLVGDGGFGPPKSVTTDLQSAPFGRSGNPPNMELVNGVEPSTA